MRSIALHRAPSTWLVSALALVVGLLAFAAPAKAAFPGANGKIAFMSHRDAGFANWEIYTMYPDGSGLTRLTNNVSGDMSPAWSPDGTKIAFRSNRDGNFEIYKMNADGSGQTRLTNNAALDTQPAWSPDGSKIAFTSDRDGNNEIYTMNADGTSPSNLTNNAATDSFPAWSPDGTKIAFTSSGRDDPPGNDEIYVMNADGTSPTNLTNNAASDAEPDWSPDGTKIAFISYRPGGDQVYVMNADGTAQSNVSGTNGDLDPAWSPDGTKIAFTSNPGNDEIYKMNADGTLQTNLTSNAALDQSPDWQPTYQIPKSASTIDVALVPAYRQTISASQCMARLGTPSTHGSPDIPGGTNPDQSCIPPGYAPGTVASFGIQAVGSAKITVVPGNLATVADEADDTIVASLSDVRTGSATGGDYNPNPSGSDVTLVAKLRISDTLNGPQQGDPGTVSDVDFSVPVDCVNTVDTNIGASCTANTSADAVVPGVIKEGKNAVVDVFRVRLNDFGNKNFAMQGIYNP